jgi:transcriptional regulator with XRE-family HTH domain
MRCLNINELKAEMARYGDTGGTLAKALGITQQSLSRKFHGKADFSRDDIETIRDRYNLSYEAIGRIFFA